MIGRLQSAILTKNISPAFQRKFGGVVKVTH